MGKKGKEYVVNKGGSAVAHKGEIHYFSYLTDSTILLLVKVSPARGPEKSVRVVYGLANDGQLEGRFTKKPWHLALLMGYSGTYLLHCHYRSYYQELLLFEYKH